MSGILQIVGQASGVSSLLSVDTSGRAVVRDADNITQTTAVNTKLTAIDTVLDASLVKQSAMAVDLAAIEVLQTGGNASLSACATDLAAIEVLQTGGNASLSACATDLAAIEVKQNAIAASLAGTLSVSAPTITTTATTVSNAVSVAAAATSTTASVDLGGVRTCGVFGSLTDGSANIKVFVSADDSTFFENSEQTIFINGTNYYKQMTIDARYVRLVYANGSGSAQDWTAIISRKA